MDCTQALTINSGDEDSRLSKEFGSLVLNKIRYPLWEGTNTIGRDEDRCEVAIPSETLSRQHAVIKIINDVAYLMDLRSINKTKIGTKVLVPYEQYRLKHGDEIYFADLPAKLEIAQQVNEEIPETPKTVRSSQKVTVLESPDPDNSKDVSFIMSSQQPTELQKKQIPLSTCPKDSIFWNASADSPSLKFDRDDTIGATRKEINKTVAHDVSTILDDENVTNSNDSLEIAMNESYNIYESSTQFGPSMHNAETQAPLEINKTKVKTLHELDTQLPVGNLSKDSCSIAINQVEINKVDLQNIHEMETQLPILVSPNESTNVDKNLVKDLNSDYEKGTMNGDFDSDEEEVIFNDFESQNVNMFNSKVTMTENSKIVPKSNYNEMYPESQNLLENLDEVVGNAIFVNNIMVKEKIPNPKINYAPQIGDDDSTDCEDDLIELSQNNLANSKRNKFTLNDSDETDCEDDLFTEKENNQNVIFSQKNLVVDINIPNKTKTIISSECNPSKNLINSDVGICKTTSIKKPENEINIATQIIEVPKFKTSDVIISADCSFKPHEINRNKTEFPNLKKKCIKAVVQTKVAHEFQDNKNILPTQNKKAHPTVNYSNQDNDIDEDNILTQLIQPANKHVLTCNIRENALSKTSSNDAEDDLSSTIKDSNEIIKTNPAYESTQDLLNDLDSQNQEDIANELTQIIESSAKNISPVKKFNSGSIFKMPTPMGLKKKSVNMNFQSDFVLDIPSPVRITRNNKPHYETAEDIMNDLLTQPICTDEIEKVTNNSEVESQDPDLSLLSTLKEPPGSTRESLITYSKVLHAEQDSISDQSTQIIHENQSEDAEVSDLICSSQENDDSFPLEHFPHLSKEHKVHRTLSDEQLLVIKNSDPTTPTKIKTYSHFPDSCSDSSMGDIFSPIKLTDLKASVRDIELPNSQEIKNAIKSSRSSVVVLESSSSSESEENDSEDTSTPIVFRKRIPMKKVLNISPVRQSNRSRKPSRKVLNSHETPSFLPQNVVTTRRSKENHINQIIETKTDIGDNTKKNFDKRQKTPEIDNCIIAELNDMIANSHKSHTRSSKTSPHSIMNNPVSKPSTFNDNTAKEQIYKDKIKIDATVKNRDKKKPERDHNKDLAINSEEKSTSSRSTRNKRRSQSEMAVKVNLQKSPPSKHKKSSSSLSNKESQFSKEKSMMVKKNDLIKRTSHSEIGVEVKLQKSSPMQQRKASNHSNKTSRFSKEQIMPIENDKSDVIMRSSRSEIMDEVKLEKLSKNPLRKTSNGSNKASTFSKQQSTLKAKQIENNIHDESSPSKRRTRSDKTEQSIMDVSKELGSRSRVRKRKSSADANNKSSENSTKITVKTLKKKIALPRKNRSVVYGSNSDSLSSGSTSDGDIRSKRSRSSSTIMDSPDAKKIRSNDVSEERFSVMFTGLKDLSLEKIVHKLGGIVVSDPSKCSVLVSERIKRTLKFLLVLGLRKPIVGFNWLYACQTTNTILDPWSYILTDREAEKKFSFSLDKTLRTLSRWLNRVQVTATPSVQPQPEELKLIVEYSGGTYVDLESVTKKTRSSRNNTKKQDLLICVSCSLPIDKQYWPTVSDAGYKIVTSEVILTGILRNKMEWKTFCLTK